MNCSAKKFDRSTQYVLLILHLQAMDALHRGVFLSFSLEAWPWAKPGVSDQPLGAFPLTLLMLLLLLLLLLLLSLIHI